MKKLLFSLLLSTAMVQFFSCSKDTPQKSAHIYVEAYQGIQNSPVYFKSGALVDPGYNATGPMFVDGSDVYHPAMGGYYKNNVMVSLPQAGLVSCIYVKDGTVYAAGWRAGGKAGYWIGNNQMTAVEPDSAIGIMFLKKIIVGGSNNDIYLGGTRRQNSSDVDIITIKNGVLTTVAEGLFKDMALAGTNLHVVGDTTGAGAGYWINGVPQSLKGLNGKAVKELYSVSVWGNDVYLTGSGGPLYWKNGVAVSELDIESKAVGVVVDNGEVIVGINRGPGHFADSGDETMMYYMQVWQNNDLLYDMGEGYIENIYLGK